MPTRPRSTGLIEGGAHAVLVETAQDLLQAKSAVNGARRAFRATGVKLPLSRAGHGRDDRHDAAGHRDRRRAHRTRAARDRPDRSELRHRAGGDERAPALPVPARAGRVCPACRTPACRSSLPTAHAIRSRPSSSPMRTISSPESSVSSLVGGCCGTTPDHIRAVVDRVGGREVQPRRPRGEPGASSLYQHVAFRQDTSFLSVGERTNTNGSKAFREAMLDGALGRRRRDRPRPDPRRRACARPLRRLRRP